MAEAELKKKTLKRRETLVMMTSEGESEVVVFKKGEKVLCFEPDPQKARVLYNSKVQSVHERTDEHGLKYYDYKVHFQGWNHHWDRVLSVDYLRKDNEENRQLQKELAEQAQLQISGGYSYKDTKTPSAPPSKKKRLTKGAATNKDESAADPLDIFPRSQQQHFLLPAVPVQQHEQPLSFKASGSGNRSRDNSDGRKTSVQGDATMKPPRAKESNVVEPLMDTDKRVHQEDRVMLRISERLREYMEYDYNMIVKFNKQHRLPARIPIVTILENFVKQHAVELAIGIKQDSTRARNTQSRNARLEREYDRVMSNVCMLKEVVDGLRIYFEFLLDDTLLYNEEREHVSFYLTVDNMKNCSEILNNSYDFINPSGDTDLIALDGTPVGPDGTPSNGGDGGSILGGVEYEKQLQKCLQYIDKNSGKNSTASAYIKRTSPYFAAYNLPMEMRGFLCETFSWRLLTAESSPERSMIFGAPHLARLLVKLPAYLNASPMTNDRLEDLIKHLDLFVNYLENHKEWFDKENYVHSGSYPEHFQRDMVKSMENKSATCAQQ